MMNPQGLLGQLNQSMQQGVPALGQVSGTSPNFDASLQPQPPTAMPQKSPATMMHLHGAAQRRGIDPASVQQLQPDASGNVTLPVQDSNTQQPGVQVPVSEAELILKALSSRLGMIGKHESAVRDHLFPQPQESAQGGA